MKTKIKNTIKKLSFESRTLSILTLIWLISLLVNRTTEYLVNFIVMLICTLSNYYKDLGKRNKIQRIVMITILIVVLILYILYLFSK